MPRSELRSKVVPRGISRHFLSSLAFTKSSKWNERELNLKLDHLTIIAPTLEAGREHIYTMLGVELPFGSCDPEMGTHNLLARLSGDTFLEVIAINPTMEDIGRPRWFGLDDRAAVQRAWNSGYRLRSWVARTSDIDAELLSHASTLSSKSQVSRGVALG